MSTTTVMRVDMDCYKCKRVALQSVARIDGIDKVSVNMKDKTLTVVGDVDAMCIVNEIRRKFKCAHLISTGPTPPPPKPKQDKKEEKKEEKKQEQQPKKEPPPKEGKKEDQPPKEQKKEEKKEDQPPKEQKKVEKEDQPPKAQPPPQQIVYYPKYIPQCIVRNPSCGPPPQHCGCGACSSRPDILWPRCHPPRGASSPDEVWYVWNEEQQQSCTIS